MARFDVYSNPDASERKHTPYFLDVQNDYIDALVTRVVIPLRREAAFGRPARDLNPIVLVGDESLVLDTAALAAVPVAESRKPITNLRNARASIQDALDSLFGAN